MIEKLIINVDGASKGNPGPASIGVTLKDEHHELVGTISRRIGMATNNQAEYTALIAALKRALEMGVKQVVVNSDSELLVKQINGLYRVKNIELRQLYGEVIKLAYSLETFTIVSVPREQNREADKLANTAFG